MKLLAERFAADVEIQRRFRREALTAARLSGEPNTVTIFDVGEWRGTPFIVMEYLSGGTLEHVLRRGAQPPERALPWLAQAALSLDAAHARGVVHRDVKPANLLLDEPRVHVGDFGIATAAGLDSLTLTGTVLGTAGYLAPEQAQGLRVTAATDTYALGVVAYELLTGTRPFARDSLTAEAAAHAYEAVPSAAQHDPALPQAVDAVFEVALAKDPGARFATCTGLVSALRAACAHAPVEVTRPAAPPARAGAPTRLIRPRRRRWPALAAGLLLLAAAGVGGALFASTVDPSRTAATSTSVRTITRSTTVVSHPTKTVRATTTPAAVPPRTPANASDLNTRGYRLMLQGDYTAALPLLRRAVTGLTEPGNQVTAYANFNLGQTLVRLGQCDAALPFLRRAEQTRDVSPRSPRRACLRGTVRGHPPGAFTFPGDSGSRSGRHSANGQDEGNRRTEEADRA